MPIGPVPSRITKSLVTDLGAIGLFRGCRYAVEGEIGESGNHLTRTVKSGSEIDSPRQTGHRPGRFGLSRFRNT
jgi:hypothetical protein